MTKIPRLPDQTSKELLELYAGVMRELRERRIIRSSNNPTADYAETLVCHALNLDRVPQSTRGYDATDSEGERYEVKGRRPTPENPSRQLSAIRGLDQKHFSWLAGVVFDEDFTVLRACLIPWSVVKSQARYREHVNAWILQLNDAIWGLDGVVDITEVVKGAQDSL